MLPKVTNVNISNETIDQALSKGLDNDGLLRLKAVEMAIYLSMNKDIANPETLDKIYKSIYKFYSKDEKQK